MLTDNEKASIINSHIRNVELNKYNAEILIKSEEALDEPNSELISMQNSRIQQFNSQITALQSELSKLNVTEEINNYATTMAEPPTQQG